MHHINCKGLLPYDPSHVMKSATYDLKEIASNFAPKGEFAMGKSLGCGHINDTYEIEYATSSTRCRYVLQRINTDIFKDPKKVMENVIRVTHHQRNRLAAIEAKEIERKCLTFFPVDNGDYFYCDGDGNYWRMCLLIQQAHTCDVITSTTQAFEVAASFARFQKTIVDLPGGRLHETIPDFHNTIKRFSDFKDAVSKNLANRVGSCKNDIEFAMKRNDLAGVLITLMEQKKIPERTTHNDAKLNNVMLDNLTNRGICVIDLDTIMPGSSLYDFGDMVRSSSCIAPEDERDLDKVEIDPDLFGALARGYLSEAKDFLNAIEIKHLPLSGKLITFEQGLRFLTDYLNNDIYYKTDYPDHNLVRARNQFKLVESLEINEKKLFNIVMEIMA